MLDERAIQKWRPFFLALLALFFALLAYGLRQIFLLTPNEKTMGFVQKIMYIHVPSAWNAFFSFGAVFVFSVLFLTTRKMKYDILAHACVETGVMFATFVLITGPLWARPAWNTFWDWKDARLVSTLVLWLIYVGYLMLRATAENRGQRARLAAVVGIVGFCDVPIIHMSVLWWRTIHPQPVVMDKAAGVATKLDPRMRTALLVMLLAFNILFFVLVYHRASLEIMKEKMDALKQARARRLEEIG